MAWKETSISYSVCTIFTTAGAAAAVAHSQGELQWVHSSKQELQLLKGFFHSYQIPQTNRSCQIKSLSEGDMSKIQTCYNHVGNNARQWSPLPQEWCTVSTFAHSVCLDKTFCELGTCWDAVAALCSAWLSRLWSLSMYSRYSTINVSSCGNTISHHSAKFFFTEPTHTVDKVAKKSSTQQECHKWNCFPLTIKAWGQTAGTL